MQIAIVIVLLIALVLTWALSTSQSSPNLGPPAAYALPGADGAADGTAVPANLPELLAAARVATAAYSAAAVNTAKLLAPVISADFSQLAIIVSMGITAPAGSAAPSKQAQAALTTAIKQAGSDAGAYADLLAAQTSSAPSAGAVTDFATRGVTQVGELRTQLGVIYSYVAAWGGAIQGWLTGGPISSISVRIAVASSLSLPLNAIGKALTAATKQLDDELAPALQAAVAASKRLNQ